MVPFLSQFAAEEAAETSEGIAALGLDPIAILLQAGTFLLIYLILRKYALDNIVKALEERRQKIAESIKNADDIEVEKAKVFEKGQQQLSKARDEADKIVAASHEQAGHIVAEAEAKAQKRADTIIAQAKLQAETEASEVRQALKSEMLDLVSDATENIIEEKLDQPKDQSLIKKALSRETS